MAKRDRKARRDANRLERENERLRAENVRLTREASTIRSLLEDANRANLRLSQDHMRVDFRERDEQIHAVTVTVNDRMLRELRYGGDRYWTAHIGEHIAAELIAHSYQKDNLLRIAP